MSTQDAPSSYESGGGTSMSVERQNTGWSSQAPADQKQSPRSLPQSHLPALSTQGRPEASGPITPSPNTPDSFMSDSQVLISPPQPSQIRPYFVPSHRSHVSFEWTVPNDPRSTSHIRDPKGNALYNVKSPGTRKTVIADEYGDVVAKIKFHVYSKPTVRFNRAVTMRIKDWIQFSRESRCRYILLRGDRYLLSDSGDRFSIFKNKSDTCVGGIVVDKQSIRLDLAPSVLVLLEEFVIAATTLLVSGKKGRRDTRLSDLGDIIDTT